MREQVIQLSDDRREHLDTLAAEIDAVAKSATAYLTENTDAAEPLFYSDWDIYLTRLSAEDLALVEQLKVTEPNTWRASLRDCCDALCTDIYMSDTEIASFSLGECEEQLPDDVAAALADCTPDEREYLQRAVSECYLPETGDCIYLNLNYQRWVLELDADRLAERLADVSPD